jgi:uncharacterized protein (TIGR00730 family)
VNRILVFCGSNVGARPEYIEAAAALGRLCAQRGLGVVYGGANVGLMAGVANAALEAGGEVIGVIPRLLDELEVGHRGLTQLHTVETMHERKALMAELSDAVIALPGGPGTLDELFEMFTWSQLGLHHKPIGLLDVAGYWQPLLAVFDQMVRERFLRAENRATLIVDTGAPSLLDRLADYRHEDQDKWLTPPGQDVPKTRSPASPSPGRM